MNEDEVAVELRDFREYIAKELGYEDDGTGTWFNNRIKGLAVKSGYSYQELWVTMYRIGDGPRRELITWHFTGDRLDAVKMFRQVADFEKQLS